MSNLAPLNTERLVQQFTKEELQVLKNTVAKGTTDTEFAYFIQVCQHTGLNPFTKQIYCTAYDGKHGRQFLIDYYYEGIKSLARKVAGYAGMDTQLVCEKDEFRIGKDEAGDWKVKVHDIGFPRGKILGCYSIARRDGFKDVVAFTDVEQIKHYKTGKNSHMWTNNESDMIMKHTGKRAAKDQYGLDLPDDSHEMASATVLDVTPTYNPQQLVNGQDNTSLSTSVTIIQTGEGQQRTADQILAEKREEVRQKMKQAGMNSDDLLEFAMQSSLKKDPLLMDARELVALSRLLDEKVRMAQELEQAELELGF